MIFFKTKSYKTLNYTKPEPQKASLHTSVLAITRWFPPMKQPNNINLFQEYVFNLYSKINH